MFGLVGKWAGGIIESSTEQSVVVISNNVFSIDLR